MLSGLQLENVSVSFEATHALEDVTLHLAQGEAVALVGLSGAGKTTLLHTCNAMVAPSAGRVLINGQDLSKLSAKALKVARMNIGFIHQDLSLVPNLRVIQNVVSGRLGRRSLIGGARDLLFPADDVTERVYDILTSVGIAEKIYERTDHLSGGQQQRVAIARALFQEPQFLLADEPISSVDPVRAEATIALLKTLCAERNITLLMSLHNLKLATTFFPRLVALRDGHIVFDKPTDTVQPAELEAIFDLTESSPVSEEVSDFEDRLGGRFG